MSGFSGGCETLCCRCLLFSVLIVALLAASGVHAQTSPVGGQVTTPGSSIEKPEDSGVRAHTNIEIFRPGPQPAGAGPACPSRRLRRGRTAQGANNAAFKTVVR